MNRTIPVGSVTYAQKAKRILVQKGLRARLVKQEATNDGGCSFGVEVAEEAYLDALLILRTAGVRPRIDE
ncbi:MAG: DUF3343 domain-containing protein [Clostridia bacterium]|nr:DUF3343 domain-containing protein [Clostridia bacterium]